MKIRTTKAENRSVLSIRRQLLARKLRREPELVSANSMEVLKELSQIEPAALEPLASEKP